MGKKFSPTIFFGSTLVAAIILISFLAVPQWLMMNSRWEVLRSHVAETTHHAASVVDGDLHHQLLDPKKFTEELYQRTLVPLVRFHESDPSISYVYTMVEKDGSVYFVLDTATKPEFRKRNLKPSNYMEKFELNPEYEDDWLKKIARGETYVTPTFQTDKYGTFISGHAPIYDSKGNYSGFVGIDYDVKYYENKEREFTLIAISSILTAIIMSFVIGFGFHEYHYWRPNV